MKFKAFISYNRSADNMLAVALQRSLERFGIAWYRRSKFSVFLDRVDLAVSPALWNSIRKSLEMSEFFILVASPESAASQWVNREVEFWTEYRSVETLLIVLVRGTLIWDEVTTDFFWDKTNALPATLRGRFSSEPQWLDLRYLEGSKRPSLKDARFREAVASLAAPLHGRSKRDLLDTDSTEQKKARRIFRAAVALFICLAALAGGLFYYNQQTSKSDLAQHFLSTADELLKDDAKLETTSLLAVQATRLNKSFESETKLRNFLDLLPVPGPVMDGGTTISALAFSPNGQWIAGGTIDGKTHLWDRKGNSLAQIIGTNGAPVFAIAFSPDGHWLVSGIPRAFALDGHRPGGSPRSHSARELALSPHEPG